MEYYVLSKNGTREINEDSVGMLKQGSGFCCVLADGLGGHDRGEVASALIVQRSLELFTQNKGNDVIDLAETIKKCFAEGQELLVRKQEEARSEMKTTLVVLMAQADKVQWGHVGDSRLYCFKNGQIVMRTLDHSVPQMLVRTGEIKEKEIRGHEDRNRLLRVMGSRWDSPKYEIAEAIELKAGQAFLLCSDGFWEWIEEKRMIKLLKQSSSPKQWLELMEEEIKRTAQRADMDNYSAIGVFIGTPEKRKRLFDFL